MTNEEIINKYTIAGVPKSSLPSLCKDLNINEDRLREFLNGQTTALIGGEPVIYVEDIIRFVKGLPVID